MRSPFVERPRAVSLVFVEAGGVRYVTANLGFGFVAPAVLAMIPWGFLSATWVAATFGWTLAWRLFLLGAVVALAVSAAAGLVAGTSALRHVLRVVFSPRDRPERLLLVRPMGSTELPVGDLRRVVVVNTEQRPYGPDDVRPAESLGVEVELHTAVGTETSPGRFGFDAAEVVDRLTSLLGPAGVPVERRDVVRTRRPPPLDLRARSWWTDDRVAAEWRVPVAEVPVLVHLLRVHRVILDHSLTTPGVPRNDPADVARVTEAVTDETMTRAVAGELLTDLNGLRRPLAPRAPAGSARLVAFLPEELAAAYREAAARAAAGAVAEVDGARRDLARAILGGPPAAAEPLDDVVRRALRARPYLPYGTAPP